jgi:hypothetical protein
MGMGRARVIIIRVRQLLFATEETLKRHINIVRTWILSELIGALNHPENVQPICAEAEEEEA